MIQPFLLLAVIQGKGQVWHGFKDKYAGWFDFRYIASSAGALVGRGGHVVDLWESHEA